MPDPLVILRALVIAGVVAAVVLLVLSWPWRAPQPARTALGWVLGVAGALVVADLALNLKLHWPPVEDRHRFLLVVLPAAVIAEVVAAFRQVPRWVAWLLRAVVAAGAGRVLLHGSVYLQEAGDLDVGQWNTQQTVLYLGIAAVALAAMWALLGLLLHVAPSRSVPLALAVVCGGAAVTVMFSGSATDGQLGLALAAALIGATAASLFVPTPPTGAAPIAVSVVGLFALLIGGRFFAELTSAHAVLLFVSPLLCWLTVLPAARKFKPWLRGSLLILVVALPVAIVAFQAFQASSERSRMPSSEEDDSYEQFYK